MKKKVALIISIMILIAGGIHIKYNIETYHSDINETNNKIATTLGAIMTKDELKAIDHTKSIANNKVIQDHFINLQDNTDDVTTELSLLESDNPGDYFYIASHLERYMITVPHFDMPDGYNPSERGWYKEAVKADGPIVTGIYVDAFTMAPVITSAVALRNPEIYAVVGTDHTLSELSDFMLTVSNVGIFNLESEMMVSSETTVIPMNLSMDDFENNTYETDRYTYNRVQSEYSKHYIVYGSDTVLEDKLLTSSAVQHAAVYLLLSVFSYILLTVMIKKKES